MLLLDSLDSLFFFFFVCFFQMRLPGGTGVAMAARDDSRAVLVGMWTK